MQKLINKIKPDWYFLFLVILLGLLAGYWLLRPGYFNMHDDLQMMRQLVMEGCFKDGQIPCRWTQHMAYGFGFPLFNYYPPLPYLVGEVIRTLGFSFVETVKYTFFLSFILSGIAMYLLAREFWGKLGAILSAAFYIWAPYHSVDIYVRGAMNEAWSFVWFPLILWSSYRLVREAQFRWIVILALSWFALLLSHNLMVLIFAPVFVAWVLLWLVRERSWFTLPQLIVSGAWAIGLAAFFTIPVVLEKNLVHVETLTAGYYNYTVHFVGLNQLLFSRFWGYGASVWGIEDQMPFQIGHIHWVLALGIFALATFSYLRKRKPVEKLLSDRLVAVAFFFATGWFAAFMAHPRSVPIWQAIGPLEFVQFPWRFLSIVVLSFSTLAGGITLFFGKGKGNFFKWLVVAVLIIGVIFFNKDYFKPEKTGPLTDQEKFSGGAWEKQQTAGIYDYLPKTARTAPKDPRKLIGEVLYGKGEVTEARQNTNSVSFKVRIESDEATVRIHILQFPGWKVFVDGKETETFVGEDDWGRMNIKISQGEHEVRAKLYNTPTRTAGNLISLFSWLVLFTIPIWRRR